MGRGQDEENDKKKDSLVRRFLALSLSHLFLPFFFFLTFFRTRHGRGNASCGSAQYHSSGFLLLQVWCAEGRGGEEGRKEG